MPAFVPHLRRLMACGVASATMTGLVLLGAPATANVAATAPIGGDQLGSTGVVYDQAAGLPAPPAVTAAGWVVADLDTGNVLAASNPHGLYGPASTLKVLSTLVMLPVIEPTAQIMAKSADVKVDGSKVGVVPNHLYTADQLFTATLVVSGNDAVRVLASALGGEDNVVSMMNAKAADLQANDTVAKTVTGLDAPGQTTSAYDLALISRAALDLPSFRKYVAITNTQFGGVDVAPFAISNHNLLLSHYPGTYGVKNGYTDASRATYVGAAKQNGHNLMVTMVRADPDYRNNAEALLTWGFNAVGKARPVGTLVGPGSAGDDLSAPGSSAITGASRHSADGAHRSGGAGLSGLEYGAIGAGGAVAVLFVGRRRQIKRRRQSRRQRRLQLPNV